MKYIISNLLCGMFIYYGCVCEVAGQSITTTEGEDYSLSGWVAPELYSGYGSSSPDGVRIKQKNWHVSWRMLEPVRGQYNWALVDQELEKARQGGYTISMHLTSIVVAGVDPNANNKPLSNDVPERVITDLHAPTDTLSWTFNLRVIPGWREDIRDAFNTLIREFGKKGYPQQPEIGCAYIHGISRSRGEEFGLDQATAERIRLTLGFTPEAVTAWIKSRIDAYAEAFGDAAYKLAWVGNATSFNFGDYKTMSNELLQYAWAKGAGNRGGGVEWYNGRLNDPAFGQWLKTDGYLWTDEAIPPIATARYFGEENEEYGAYWPWRWGPVEDHPYRCRMATLRGLQMLFRWMWVSTDTEKMNPPLFEYSRLSFGKTVYNSPDAWAYLREAYVWPAPGYMKNFERWLYQRDIAPDGVTQSTRKVMLSYDPGGKADYEYMARSTQVAAGRPYMYFNLDDRFTVIGPVEIKVEIWDNTTAGMRIEYNSAGAADTPTAWYTGKQDMVVRTVTFSIADADFRNALPGGMDFCIAVTGGDVTVQWVRVVRQSLPDVPTSVEGNGAILPDDPALPPNYPNPFNPETHVRISVPHAGDVELAVFDLLGRRVRTLVSESMIAGVYIITWDGRSDRLQPAVSGVYILRMQYSSGIVSRKILLLR